MKERPILFSGPMVRAILDGRKTQARRVVKPSSGPHTIEQVISTPDSLSSFIRHRCPHGIIGDRLWVRETFARSRNNWLYRASSVASEGPQGNTDDWDWDTSIPNHWRPSIFMPRKASRITLEITGVRVERLSSISTSDCLAEGVTPGVATDHPRGPEYTAFRSLWQSINGPGSWDANPWVWCIEFRKI